MAEENNNIVTDEYDYAPTESTALQPYPRRPVPKPRPIMKPVPLAKPVPKPGMDGPEFCPSCGKACEGRRKCHHCGADTIHRIKVSHLMAI